MKMEKKIIYFDEPGPQNTDLVIESAEDRLKDSRIKYVVVASESGETALKDAKALKDLHVKVICVSGYAGIRRVESYSRPDIAIECLLVILVCLIFLLVQPYFNKSVERILRKEQK